MRHISARFAPLPPSSGFIDAVAIGLAAEEVDVLSGLRLRGRLLPCERLAALRLWSALAPRCGSRRSLATFLRCASPSLFAIRCCLLRLRNDFRDVRELQNRASRRSLHQRSAARVAQRADRPTMTNTSVKNLSTAGANAARFRECRAVVACGDRRVDRAAAAARARSSSATSAGSLSARAGLRVGAVAGSSRAMFLHALERGRQLREVRRRRELRQHLELRGARRSGLTSSDLAVRDRAHVRASKPRCSST